MFRKVSISKMNGEDFQLITHVWCNCVHDDSMWVDRSVSFNKAIKRGAIKMRLNNELRIQRTWTVVETKERSMILSPDFREWRFVVKARLWLLIFMNWRWSSRDIIELSPRLPQWTIKRITKKKHHSLPKPTSRFCCAFRVTRTVILSQVRRTYQAFKLSISIVNDQI